MLRPNGTKKATNIQNERFLTWIHFCKQNNKYLMDKNFHLDPVSHSFFSKTYWMKFRVVFKLEYWTCMKSNARIFVCEKKNRIKWNSNLTSMTRIWCTSTILHSIFWARDFPWIFPCFIFVFHFTIFLRQFKLFYSIHFIPLFIISALLRLKLNKQHIFPRDSRSVYYYYYCSRVFPHRIEC